MSRLRFQQSFYQPKTAVLRLGLSAWLLSLSLMPALAAEPADWTKLSQGHVVVRQTATMPVPAVEARILVNRPPSKVWDVVADPVKLMAQEAKVKKVQVVSKTGNQQNVAFSVMMTRLLPPFNYVLQQTLSAPAVINFKRVSGSFRDIRGSWRLTPTANGAKTILSYTLQLDPGPLVPKGLLLNAIRADLPSMMKNARMAINQGS